MEKLVTLESVALAPGGGVTVLLRKQVLEDNGDIFRDDPHRFTVTGDQELEAALADLDAYLALNNWPKVSADDRKFILGSAGSAAVVQARASASDFAQAVRAETETAIATVRNGAEQEIEAAKTSAAAAVAEARRVAEEQRAAVEAETTVKIAQAIADAAADADQRVAAAEEAAAEKIDAAEARAAAAEKALTAATANVERLTAALEAKEEEAETFEARLARLEKSAEAKA